MPAPLSDSVRTDTLEAVRIGIAHGWTRRRVAQSLGIADAALGNRLRNWRLDAIAAGRSGDEVPSFPKRRRVQGLRR